MRHHSHDVAFAAENAGDITQRAIGIAFIAEGNAVFGFEFIESAVIGKIAAFAVSDGQVQVLVFFRGAK